MRPVRRAADPFDSAALLGSDRVRRLYARVQPTVEHLVGIEALRCACLDVRDTGPCGVEEFLREALRRLGARPDFGRPDQFAALRDPGPVVVVANHPAGVVDAFALCLLLESMRPWGWKLVANRLLASLPELASRLVAVPAPHESGRSGQALPGLRACLGWLKEGGVVGLFPAGRISGWESRIGAFGDSPWDDHALRLAALGGARVVVLRIEADRMPWAAAVPRRFPRLRMMLLARSVLRSPVGALHLRVAAVIEPEEARRLAGDPRGGAKLHACCYLGARGAPALDAPAAIPTGASSASQAEARRLAGEGRCLAESGDFQVLRLRRDEAPALFEELARARVLAFKASGQGVDAVRDETPEDGWYDQLVLWDRGQGRVAGAYRVGRTEEVLASRGPEGMYLDGMFRFAPGFHAVLGPSMELSRSFLLPAYQRTPLGLALLWRGIARFIADNPSCRALHGCVTIPRSFSPESRAVLVDYLRRHHSDEPRLRALVRPRRPFRPRERWSRLAADAFAGASYDEVRDLVRRIEGGNRAAPPLIRLYLGLGAKFLAFHVEPSFGDAVYCLLRVAVESIPGRRWELARREPRAPARSLAAPSSIASSYRS